MSLLTHPTLNCRSKWANRPPEMEVPIAALVGIDSPAHSITLSITHLIANSTHHCSALAAKSPQIDLQELNAKTQRHPHTTTRNTKGTEMGQLGLAESLDDQVVKKYYDKVKDKITGKGKEPEPQSSTPTSTALTSLLESLSLSHYLGALADLGVTTPADITSLSEEELQADAGMKKVFFLSFFCWLRPS